MNTPRYYHNLGIMAHIDAGKITTTERILAITSEIMRGGKTIKEPPPQGPTVGDRIAAQRIENLLK